MRADVETLIHEHLPFIRSYAIRIARNRTLADDLVQNALVRAIAHADQFTPGTNFRAWMTTILRNCFLNEMRAQQRAHTQEFDELTHGRATSGGQEERVRFTEFCRTFDRLNADHRDALLMVAVEGASYEEAASTAKCAVGTMKSRVSRARDILATRV